MDGYMRSCDCPRHPDTVKATHLWYLPSGPGRQAPLAFANMSGPHRIPNPQMQDRIPEAWPRGVVTPPRWLGGWPFYSCDECVAHAEAIFDAKCAKEFR